MRRYRNVPPFQFLQGFEAAARHLSFSKAAAELGLSQSAVSHQMRLLEERIGQPLFLRAGGGVRLTDAGRDYQRTVRRSLDQLEEGHASLAPYRKPGSVVVYAPRDFAARWLLPRLGDLRADCPGADPWIDTSGTEVDFEQMEVSIAVVYQAEPPPGDFAVLLAADSLAPVLSPALATRKLRPVDLPSLTLLHDERPAGWLNWFEHAGIETGDVSAGINFSDSDFSLAAAEQGFGAALASLPLAASALAAGRLVQPFAQSLDPGRTWFAVTTPRELDDPFTRAVWQWFKQQAADTT